MTQILTRFAPSPTGYLHIGHIASALFAWDHGTTCLLRIEDIDTTRCRTEFIQSIYDDLHWLEFDWPTPVRRQSEHLADYRRALGILESRDLIYPCFCTRRDIEQDSAGAPHGPDGVPYPGTCRHLSSTERQDRILRGDGYSLRLNMSGAIHQAGPLIWFDHIKGEQVAIPEILGDVVLARKDIAASYHLCVTHDDALQNINLVTRGEDLFFATHLHRLLQKLLDYPTPAYHHHPLLTDKSGRKFSKRDKALTISDLRNKGFSAAQLKAMIRDGSFHEHLI